MLQALYASDTFTCPSTRLLSPKLNVTVRLWVPPPVTVKIPVLVPVPTALVTWITPVVAPVGTLVVICVAELTTNDADLPLKNLTAVAPVKFVPVITTLVPTVPLVGVNDVMVGVAAVTVKVVLNTVPLGFTTETLPVTAPAGTVTVSTASLTALKVLAARIPLEKFTAVVPHRCVPLMVIDDPTDPEALGEKLEKVGLPVEVTANDPPDPVPEGPLTVTAPVPRALQGTVAVREVSDPTTGTAVAPPGNVTEVALPLGSWNPVPVTVTTVPTAPVVGLSGVVTVVASAGSAVTSTPTTASPSANTVARAVTFFFGNLIEGSSLLGQGLHEGATALSLDPTVRSVVCGLLHTLTVAG